MYPSISESAFQTVIKYSKCIYIYYLRLQFLEVCFSSSEKLQLLTEKSDVLQGEDMFMLFRSYLESETILMIYQIQKKSSRKIPSGPLHLK